MDIGTVKGVGKYILQKIIPASYRHHHVNALLEDHQLGLTDKFHILNDKDVMDEWEKYWEFIFEPNLMQGQIREKYKIDIHKHAREFDPTGKTIGCGCTLCGLFKRVTSEEKKLKSLKSLLKFVDVLLKCKRNKEFDLKSKRKVNINDLDFRTFYGKHNPAKFTFKGLSLINKDYEQLFATQEKLLTKEVKLESDLRHHTETLNRLIKLAGIPIKMGNVKKMYKNKQFSKVKEKLVNIEDLSKLSVEECLDLTQELGLYNIDRRQLNNIRKELNREPVKYILSKHRKTKKGKFYIPILKHNLFYPKGIKTEEIINEITFSVSKEKATKALSGIDNISRTLLKKYRLKLIAEKTLREI